ncbi:hypothetical protein GLOIN_2v1485025 [Rhizophagus irregularis DAOM 181602=DAOM 197198]|nr:hypothetical protein GLOIN_2v1485025 [Rhizophagus irregularis DAOM 181602=DAOM 197198]
MDKENITIKELGGEKLTPISDFGDISMCDSKNICVIVQPPPFSTDGLGGTSLYKSLYKYEQNAYNIEGISLTDPTSTKDLILCLVWPKHLSKRGWFLSRHSLAQLLENYLIINSSRLLRIVGVEWYEWVGQCQKVPSILILDETQTIYEDVNKADESMKGTGTAVEFWGVIKCAFKEIRFTHEELEAYVKDCCGKNFGDDYIISQFIRYIKYATVGHVGLVRHILQHTKDAMQRIRMGNREFLREGLDMEEHNRRFDKIIGEYKEIVKVTKETTIIDIRSESKEVRKLKKGFVHV